MGTAFVSFTFGETAGQRLRLDGIWQDGQMPFASLQLRPSQVRSGQRRQARRDAPHPTAGWDLTAEVGRIVFRAIIETMQSEAPTQPDWTGPLDAAYGIKYLSLDDSLGDAANPAPGVLLPAFDRALASLATDGPPSYYPSDQIDLFEAQIAALTTITAAITG